MSSDFPTIVIIGAGPSGLLLAITLKKRLGLCPHVFEQAPQFIDGIGGAFGMYPNGLRVLRWLDPALLAATRAGGVPFERRHWQRHDGTHVATGEERFTYRPEHREEEKELASMGIRRWKFQKLLVEYARGLGLSINMNHRLVEVRKVQSSGGHGQSTDPQFECVFTTIDGKPPAIPSFKADVVFGCDGLKSRVRASPVFGGDKLEPEYTGLTVLMGAAAIPRPCRGICFPSSATSKIHAVFYPTGESEQVFQLYIPCPERPETWGPLPREEAKKECERVARQMEADGWCSEFVEPVRNAQPESLIRVGLRARDPLPSFSAQGGRIVLVGDSAHPPVPYIGQGCMMAFEDVATIVILLERLCFKRQHGASPRFDPSKLPLAAACYDALRIPRTALMYQSSHALGRMQLERAEVERLPPASAAVDSAIAPATDSVETTELRGTKTGGLTSAEESIKKLVDKFGNLPVMMRGAGYDPIAAVSDLLSLILDHTDGTVQAGRRRARL